MHIQQQNDKITFVKPTVIGTMVSTNILQPKLMMKESNILCQHMGPYFRSYKKLVNLQNKFSSSLKSSYWSIYIFSSSYQWRKDSFYT